MKQRIRLTESDLHRIVKEAIVKEAKKKVPKKGKIKFNNEWVDATEDKPDRYGNPMFKIKDKGKTKRVQNFNFRPNQMEESVIRLTESDLHRIVKESVKRILREMDEGKVVNNKSYFRNLDDSGVAEKGDSVWKYTNRDKSPEELEKHNKRAKNYKMNNDPLALRKHQLDSMDFDGPNTIQGKLRRKKDDEALMDDFCTNRW